VQEIADSKFHIQKLDVPHAPYCARRYQKSKRLQWVYLATIHVIFYQTRRGFLRKLENK